MMNSYEENLQLLINKVDGVNDLSWDDLCDRLNLDVHPDSLRKAFSVTDYCGYQVAQYYINKSTQELTADMIAKIQTAKDAEYKERVRLQDARREYNKTLREDARFANLVDVMKEQINDLPTIDFGYEGIDHKTGVKAALLISDLHYGATSDNVLNLYNIEVCNERMQTLLNKTIHYCTIHHVDELFVNLGGDLVSGLIHVSGRVEQEEDVITQTMQVAELLSKFIAELSKKVPNIKVVGVQGNHSRVSADRRQSLNPENFERIIFEYISNRLGIPVIRNGLEDWVAYNIGERNVFLEHGDKSSMGSAREQAINVLGYVPDDIFVGHFHHMEVIDKHGTDVVVNGSVMGTDAYAMKHRLHTKPYQILRIYDGDDVCTYKVML